MKVIDYDPAKKIPQITEHDIDNKIIIEILRSPTESCFLSYMEKDLTYFNKLHFRGIYIGKINEISNRNHKPVVWSDQCNHGESVISLLINAYKYYSGVDWAITYIVLESDSDLRNFMISYNLHGTPFGFELLTHWKCLAKSG